MRRTDPFIDDTTDHRACWFCPSLRLPAGGFDVLDGPSHDYPFDAADGFRYHRVTRVPACVHPERVGLEAGRYRSEGRLPELPEAAEVASAAPVAVAEPPPRQGPDTAPARALLARRTRRTKRTVHHELAPFEGPLPPGVPDRIDDLASWIRSLLADAQPDHVADVLAGAEAAARERFPDEAVLCVLRQVLAGDAGLTRR
ncbi:hypothetical protein AB0D04_06560 [Streptomyces sp. NPDC048483]|uniref:hypothetical protein n=1 Tax=Streptomyces sp. NPDC048483 TaxID=3154927 RepID=UPI00341E5A47